MSYDLLVFDQEAAPKKREEFLAWFETQAEWSENHSYEDHTVSTAPLRAWFEEMIVHFPPMNGPLASDDVDNENVTDYCIGRHVIYSAFSWSLSDQAHSKMRELAEKHSVGFFDVSAKNGEIYYPGSGDQKTWWKFWRNT